MTFADRTIDGFLEDVASGTVTPGGGAVTAIGGASGTALFEMVCNNTVGNDEYADVAAELADVRDELGAYRERLLELADEDSAAMDELLAAYGTPDGEGRAEAIQEASKRATDVPLETAEACLDVLERAAVVTEKGNPNAVPDAEIGAFLVHAALEASLFTVRLNLDPITDEAYVSDVAERSAAIRESADEAFTRVRSNVDDTV